VAAKARIAVSHDIFIGHGSTGDCAKAGSCKSVASLLSPAAEALYFREGIFTTIAQDKLAKRLIAFRVKRTDADNLSNIFPIQLLVCCESGSPRRVVSGPRDILAGD